MNFLDKIEDETIKKEISEYINTLRANLDKQKQVIKSTNEDLSKANDELTKIKTVLGVEPSTPINEDLIKVKLGEFKNEDIGKIEAKYNELIENLNNKFKEKEVELRGQIEALKAKEKNLILDGKIKEIIPNIKPQKGALEDIVNNLKANATLDEVGNIQYKSPDGTIIRDENGLPLNINGMVKRLKESKPYLFSSEIEEGANMPQNRNPLSATGTNNFGDKMRAKALQLGLSI